MSMFTAGTASTRQAVDLSLHQSELVTSAAIYKNSCDSCHAAKRKLGSFDHALQVRGGYAG